MKKKSTYKNATRSRTAIKNAVITLLTKEKSFDGITVSAVVKEAGINRGTFYNHYKNVGEVVNEIEDELTMEITESWHQTSKDNDSISDFVLNMNNRLKENEALYKRLVHYIPDYVFDDMKEKLLSEIERATLEDYELASISKTDLFILANGVVGTYVDYFEGRIKISLDDIARNSISLIEKVLPKRL
jgi:AcrR family transcriptional regulator